VGAGAVMYGHPLHGYQLATRRARWWRSFGYLVLFLVCMFAVGVVYAGGDCAAQDAAPVPWLGITALVLFGALVCASRSGE
jgi:hypothetical protein